MSGSGTDTPADLSGVLAQAQQRFLSQRNDRLTSELVTALREVGLDPLVLKGASTRAWLGQPDRPSADIDILLAPRYRRRAERVLRSRGYRRILGVHADNWVSDDGPPVDLHRTLPRLRVNGTQAWAVLQAHRVALDVGFGSIDVLDRPAHLIHLAIHATQDDVVRSRQDLRAAVDLADEACVTEAVELSRSLGVSPSVAWALSREGVDDVASRFGIPHLDANDPMRSGWESFLHSPVHVTERWRRAMRVIDKWFRWNALRAWHVLTLRSVRVRRLMAAVRRGGRR